MNWIQNIANAITALWNGNLCQGRNDEAKIVVVEKEPPQTPPPVDNSAKSSENNQSSGSQKLFSPELKMASSSFPTRPVDHIFFKTYKQTDKLELCKRILKDSFPTDEGDDAKNTFNTRLSKCFEEKKFRIFGADFKLRFQNLNDDEESKNLIASELNGLQKINYEELKERIDIILENLNNKAAFNYYMNYYPKTPSSSREGSPEIVFSRESPVGMTKGPYLPARFMTPMGFSKELLIRSESPFVEIG